MSMILKGFTKSWYLMANFISTKWEQNQDGTYTCMHFTDVPDKTPKEDKDMMIRHCFLEVLSLLEIIEYDRGYDGYYYDITVRKR